MLKKREIKTYQVQLICDDCGTPMDFTGHITSDSPVGFIHRCPKCGRTETQSHSYPITEYEYVDYGD